MFGKNRAAGSKYPKLSESRRIKDKQIAKHSFGGIPKSSASSHCNDSFGLGKAKKCKRKKKECVKEMKGKDKKWEVMGI